MVVTDRLYTADDLLAMPDDSVRHELLRGELQAMSPPGDEHGALALEIGTYLRLFVRQHQIAGHVTVETGYILARDPDSVFAPDVAYVSKARHARLTGKFIPVPPDLAVEVMSPFDSAITLHEKVNAYLEAGTPLVWVIYPKPRTLTVHTADGAHTLALDDTLDGGAVLSGFALPLRDLFAVLED